MDIKVIIFDIGGVILTNMDAELFDDLADEFEISPDQVERVISEVGPDFQTGSISLHEFWERFCGKIAKPVPQNEEEVWSRAYKATSIPIDETIEIANSLKAQGFKIACLSNTEDLATKFNRERGVYNMFDPVILSNEVGMRKPNKDIFEYTLDKLGVAPQHCVFIDDNVANIETANSMGFNTVHFHFPEELRDKLSELGINV